MNYDFDKYKSTIHHYIPKFFINGFVNTDGFLFVYDKKANKIFDNPRSPKSVFYERNRNTVQLGYSKSTSFIEDLYFKRLDNDASKVLQYLSDSALSDLDFSIQKMVPFYYFLISLFWRIPATDYAVQDIINRMKPIDPNINPELINKDENFLKVQRQNLAFHTVKEIKEFGRNIDSITQVYQFNKDTFVLGDNPILFRSKTSKFSEFMELDKLVSISNLRVFSSTTSIIENLTLKKPCY